MTTFELNNKMADTVVVHTLLGPVRGRAQVSGVTGTRYYSFQGVPYAKPPVGPLRFKAPVPTEPWEEVWDATKEACPAPGFVILHEEVQQGSSEDCLYLNIYTTHTCSQMSSERRAVMFYIHGGGFNAGNGNADIHGPDYLLEHDVVVITLNYRLGVLGNNGMKDMVMALRWVKEHIQQFGGDPANVTVFGQSAGAAAVHYLTLSSLARGLFHRGICMSGTAFNPTGLVRNPRANALCLAKLLGCEADNDQELLDFFRTLPPEEFLKEAKNIQPLTNPEENYVAFGFTPVIEPPHDGAFLSSDPEDLVCSGPVNDVPLIFGGTSMEALLLMKGGCKHVRANTEEDIKMMIPPDLRIKMGTNLSQECEMIRKRFFSEGFDAIKFFKIVSPRMYWAGIDKAVRYNCSRSRTYLYYFSFDGACNVSKKVLACQQYPGACHADDLGYVFNCSAWSPPAEPGSKERFITDLMTKLFTNFAKYNDPTPEKVAGLSWPPCFPPKVVAFEVTDNLRLTEEPEQEYLQLWKDLYLKYK